MVIGADSIGVASALVFLLTSCSRIRFLQHLDLPWTFKFSVKFQEKQTVRNVRYIIKWCNYELVHRFVSSCFNTNGSCPRKGSPPRKKIRRIN